MEYTILKNGIKMPMEGFGVFQVRDKEECKASVLTAIRAGYRLIDTAASYTNEDAVGEAVREAIAEEMKQIAALDMGYQGTAIKHFDPEFVRMCVTRRIHD